MRIYSGYLWLVRLVLFVAITVIVEEWPDGGGTAQLKDDNGVLIAECTYLPNTGPNPGDGVCPP